MTTEQQILFDLARSHTRCALDRLNESNVSFALSHVNEAKRALELFQKAGGGVRAANALPPQRDGSHQNNQPTNTGIIEV